MVNKKLSLKALKQKPDSSSSKNSQGEKNTTARFCCRIVFGVSFSDNLISLYIISTGISKDFKCWEI